VKVSVHASFYELPGSARKLCESMTQVRWFDSLDWYQCLWSTVLEGTAQLRLYVVSDEAGDALACLFCRSSDKRRRELSGLSNYYTMDFSPLVKPGVDAGEAGRALAKHIGSERPRWRTIQFDYLKGSNPATTFLVDALAQAGFAVYRHHQYDNWYLACQGTSFENYYAARPSRLRNTVERKSRKLYKLHQVTFKLFRSPADDIERGMRDYTAVYESSWKKPEPYPAFMPELARRLAMHDSLRLGVLYVDGQPAAAQFWITTQAEACIYKLAYDEKYADFSVGAVLSREMFRQALDVDHTSCIDYGVGSESYKREWMSGVRAITGIRAHSWKTGLGLVRMLTAQLRATTKRMLSQPD